MGKGHGSQPNLQWLIKDNAEAFINKIKTCDPKWKDADIEFLWPIEKEDYAEFSITDNRIWSKLNLQCPEDIRNYRFWPSSGAKWDAVAIISHDKEKTLLLIEAKAHLGELMYKKDLAKISTKHQDIIRDSIEKTWRPLAKKTKTIEDWLRSYQFANRVAYTKHLLNNKIQTKLLYVLFCDEQSKFSDVTGKDGWELQLKKEYNIMGLSDDISEIKDFYNVIYTKAPTKEQLRKAGIHIDIDKY